MPTLARAASASPAEPHQVRRVAESFGTDPDRYDRTRPRYPQPLVDQIIAMSPGPYVLDVGIGTGVSAQPFREAGCQVLGVEVDSRMAEFARRRGFDVEVARFEDWNPAGRRFDAVIAGMTWHWVDPVAGAMKVAELLRPEGLLAVFWNVHQAPPELASAFAEVYRRVWPDSPFGAAARDPVEAYNPILENAAAGIRATSALTDPSRLRFNWERSYSTDEWLEQVPTFGGHGLLAPDRLDQLLSGIGAAIDDAGGSFIMRYAALALTAFKD